MIPDNNILDIILSTVLIYAMLSILVSVLIEWWQHFKESRSKFLKKAIDQLLNDPLNTDIGGRFYDNYQIDGMRNKAEARAPAYISSTTFAQVLVNMIGNPYRNTVSVQLKAPAKAKAGKRTLKAGKKPVGVAKQYEVVKNPGAEEKTPFERGLDALNSSELTQTIRSYWERSEKDQGKMIELLARWYDDYMDRAGGWFKADQRSTFRWFGFIVALVLNADSLHMIKMLSIDEQLRSRMVATAENVANEYTLLSDSAKGTTAALRQTLRDIPSDTSKRLILRRNATIDSLKSKLQLNDSLGRISMQRADSIYGIVAGLNIPMGWSRTTAPVSWVYNWSDWGKDFPRSPGVVAYQLERNTPSVESILMYVLGMAITGFMLSFGAPFWFETLVKLINIRRAGVKPEPTNTSPTKS